ncbi:G2/mitotic-specific cyclin, partial [Nowakowskiella sp. JEL0407]
PQPRQARATANENENKTSRVVAATKNVVGKQQVVSSKPLGDQKNNANVNQVIGVAGTTKVTGKPQRATRKTANDENAVQKKPTTVVSGKQIIVEQVAEKQVQAKAGGKALVSKENSVHVEPVVSDKVEKKSHIPKLTQKVKPVVADENTKPDVVEKQATLIRKTSVLAEHQQQEKSTNAGQQPVRKHSQHAEIEREQATKKVRVTNQQQAEQLVEVKSAHPVIDAMYYEEDEDDNDPMMVEEYAEDIIKHLKQVEITTMPSGFYMDGQTELSWSMRTILVEWLIDTHNKFRMLPETLFLAVNILDRFLSLRVCSLNKLQLVGITSLFLAAKYEEMSTPAIQQMLILCDDTCKAEEVLKAERYILQVLEFGLQYPSPLNFLRRYSKEDNYDSQTRTTAKYLMEMSLLSETFLQYPPSLVAAAALHFARNILQRPDGWHEGFVEISGYEPNAVDYVQSEMLRFLIDGFANQSYGSLYRKYSSRKYMKASLFIEEWLFHTGYLAEDAEDKENLNAEGVDGGKKE